MTLPSWPHLLLLMTLVLTLCMYAVIVAGHFPASTRDEKFSKAPAVAVLWASVAVAVASALCTLGFAIKNLPWYSAMIGGGLMVLAAPLVTQCFSDKFVDSAAALVVFSAGLILLDYIAYSMT